jgi:hypothetical protein
MQANEKIVGETVAKSSGSSDQGIGEFAPPTKQTYVTKMDWRLIPILGCTYTILFLDRTNSESECRLP